MAVKKHKLDIAPHYHWSRPSQKAVSHSHDGGHLAHIHRDKGWSGYGRTLKSIKNNGGNPGPGVGRRLRNLQRDNITSRG